MYKFVYLFSNIKRIIFQSMIKFNGQDTELVSPNQVKQIAGRAGRYGTVHDQGGLVTTLQRKDLEHLKRCMNTPNQNVVAAGLLPTSDHIVNLTHACPNLSLPSIFDLYLNHSSVGQSYFLCLFRDLKRLALILQEYRNIKIRDRFQLACAPVKTTDDYVVQTFKRLMYYFDREHMCQPNILVPKISTRPESSLQMAESVYRSLDLYLWLATHFPERFSGVDEARQKREECAAVANQALQMISSVKSSKIRY